ncbi:PqqD family protein [Bacillus altitudinis]|uniref:PqqD family protein n=1 Tax=Bacillus TaxID=1386 RepID=UPI002F95E648
MSLNQVEADFYERIDGQREFISIVTEIAEEYDTDVQTCIKDLQALSKQLIEKEVVYVK